MDQGQYQEALGVWNHCVETHPDALLAYFNRANALWALNARDQAIADLDQAEHLAESGLKAEVLRQKVHMLFASNRPWEAGQTLKDLVALNPDDSLLRYELARHHIRFKQFERAEPLLKALCLDHPDNEEFAFYHAVVLSSLDRVKEALERLDPFVHATDSRELRLNHAVALEKLGRFAEAEAALLKLRAADGDEVDLTARLLRVAHDGKLASKPRWRDELLALTKDNPAKISTYLWALYLTGDLDQLFNTTTSDINLMPWDTLVQLAHSAASEARPRQPAGTGDTVGPSDKPVLLAACDEAYFEQFAPRFYESAERNAPQCRAHVHLIKTGNPGYQPDFQPPRDAILTSEVLPNASKTALACRRFTLLPELLKLYRQPIICLDVDVYINRDPVAVVEASGDVDARVYRRSGEIVIHQQSLAGFMLVQPTERGCKFANIVAGYCSYFLERGTERWFLDQMALFAAVQLSEVVLKDLSVGIAPPNALDWSRFDPSSFVWAAKGDEVDVLGAATAIRESGKP